jgi:hypothetical protein
MVMEREGRIVKDAWDGWMYCGHSHASSFSVLAERDGMDAFAGIKSTALADFRARSQKRVCAFEEYWTAALVLFDVVKYVVRDVESATYESSALISKYRYYLLPTAASLVFVSARWIAQYESILTEYTVLWLPGRYSSNSSNSYNLHVLTAATYAHGKKEKNQSLTLPDTCRCRYQSNLHFKRCGPPGSGMPH